MTRSIMILLAALTMGVATTVADDKAEAHRPRYEYTADEVNSAAEEDLAFALAPFRRAGVLNRNTPEFERVNRLFARMINVAIQQSDLARKLDWALNVHEGRLAEAYSRAGGKLVISARFLEHYRLTDAELALVIGHEIGHVICEHERMNLSAVWRRNASSKVAVRDAIGVLDTEPMVRALAAPVVRLQERVADRIGLELATETGFDPIGALGFFDKSADEGDRDLYPHVHDTPAERKSLLLKTATSYRPIPALFRARELNCAA